MLSVSKHLFAWCLRAVWILLKKTRFYEIRIFLDHRNLPARFEIVQQRRL